MMLIIVLLLLMVALPVTGFMFLTCLQGIWEVVTRWLTSLPDPPRSKAVRPLPPISEDGPQWWWRWQKKEQWYRDHPPVHIEPVFNAISRQPVPKEGRAIAKTWQEQGYKTGVINLETGEVFEPHEKEVE